MRTRSSFEWIRLILIQFQAEEIPFIKIYHYCGSLNVVSRNSFKRNLCALIEFDLAKETKKMQKAQHYDSMYLRCLILDFSALSYIDPSAVSSLVTLVKEFNKLHICVFISGVSCKFCVTFVF